MRVSQQIAVDEHLAQRGIVRQHRNDGVAPHGICRIRGNLGAGTFKLAQRLGRLVPCPHVVSGLEQVRRHGLAHPAGAEKSDLHRCHPLPPNCTGTRGAPSLAVTFDLRLSRAYHFASGTRGCQERVEQVHPQVIRASPCRWRIEMRTPWVLPVLLLSALVTPASAKGLSERRGRRRCRRPLCRPSRRHRRGGGLSHRTSSSEETRAPAAGYAAR